MADAEVGGRGRPLRAARAAARILLLALGAAPALAAGEDRLDVLATTTVLASLLEAVGGARVSASALVPPDLNAEDYQPHLQDLARLKTARLVVRVGLDYDLWLDRLLAQAQNPALGRGGPGYVDASFGIAVLDVRGAAVGPTGGHAHGSGNPHYWLDPANAEIITATILEALARLDPPAAKRYESQRLRFVDDLRSKLAVWERTLAPLQGRPMVAYHNTWAYFARHFRLNFAGFIEERAGVPPSPAHLAGLLRAMREQQITVIVREPHEPERNTTFLADKTGARVVVLASAVGAVPAARDYISLFDYNASALAAAFR